MCRCMRTIGIGVSGCGNIAQIRYFPTIQALAGCALRGVTDPNLSLRAEMATRYGAVQYGDANVMFKDPSIDGVIICSPPVFHTQQCLAALEQGKDVLLEKPVALNSADVRYMIDAARKSGRFVMALPYGGYSYIRQCVECLDEGVIGEIATMDGMMAHSGPTHAAWFFDREQVPGGVLSDLGVYILSLFVLLGGSISSVSAGISTRFPVRQGPRGEPVPVTVEDTCDALVRFESGKTATFRCNWNTGTVKGTNVWDIKIYGTKGIVFLNLFSSAIPMVVYRPDGAPKGFLPVAYAGLEHCYAPPEAPMDMCLDIMEAFRNLVASRNPALIRGSDLETQLCVTRAIEGLYLSAKEKRWVDIQ